MKSLIIANWKSNPDAPGRAELLARTIDRGVRRFSKTEVVIAPPYHFFSNVGQVLGKAKLGAQNMFWEDVGPYTGEISWHHLKHLQIAYVIIGHSERKRYLGETEEMIQKKLHAALKNGLQPILCIGEEERHAGGISPNLGKQLKTAITGIKKNWLKNLVVAYEPIWAISTTPHAAADTPDNAFRVSLYMRKILTDEFGRTAADRVRIIYGGSVDSRNIASFLEEGGMQGVLVGSASLHADEFIQLVARANNVAKNSKM